MEGGNMAAKAIDLDSYQRLLSEAHPWVPRTSAENERLLEIVECLQEKDRLSPEEQTLMDLLLVLIEKFEDDHDSTKKVNPPAMLGVGGESAYDSMPIWVSR
jgi:HTH-type transcriptional regulator/antitoxin HigA